MLNVADVTDNIAVCAIHFPNCTKWKHTERNKTPDEPPTFFPNKPASSIPATPLVHRRQTCKSTASARLGDPDRELKRFMFDVCIKWSDINKKGTFLLLN